MFFVFCQTRWQGLRLLLLEAQAARWNTLEIGVGRPAFVGRGLLEQFLRHQLRHVRGHVDGIRLGCCRLRESRRLSSSSDKGNLGGSFVLSNDLERRAPYCLLRAKGGYGRC